MELSEKLYQLRKQQGLSQEQLAGQLNVSRQAVSKWESGTATPETEKLLAISNYFKVSLDYLMKESIETFDTTAAKPEPANSSSQEVSIAEAQHSPAGPASTHAPGIILSIGGILALCLWGLLSLLRPEAQEQLAASSRITLDGNGIFLLLCIAAIVWGAWLLLKDRHSN